MNLRSIMRHITISLFFLVLSGIEAKLKEGDCEVCIKFLTKFEKSIEDADRKDQNVLTKKLKAACNKAGGKENRFCYYVGGTKDAATYILNEITRPLSYFKTVDRICEDLKQKDPQICSLRYDKDIDWKTVNLKKLKVRDLKKILSDWGESCNGCLEKSEFIKKVESVKNQHVEL